MAVSLIDLAKDLFNGNVISQAGSSLNESEGGIRKAAEALVPTILAALFSKGQSTQGAGLNNLLNQANSLSSDGNIATALDQTASAPHDDSWSSKAAGLLHSLFDGRTQQAVQMISGYSGLKESSTRTLLSAATPAVLGLTARQASAEGKTGDSGLWAYLLSMKDRIWSSFPAGFSIAGLLGGLGSMASPAASTSAASAAGYTGSRKKGGGWLWILLLALIILALWYFLGQKGCNKEHPDAAPMDTTMAASGDTPATTTTTTTTTRESMKVLLPGGVELDAFKGGIEDQLVTFLNTDYKALGADSLKKIWFDFDNLNFETGSARITAESQVQINNLAAILKAFPGAKLKIGGYTDKTGNEPANVKLSGERATAVKKALEAAGVGAQVDGAEGYGSQYAKYAADAPETDRVKDRHVSVSVRG